MREIFLEIININVLGSYLILAVLFARFLLRKAPKKITCFLWLLVGIRFLIPFSVESSFSLIPSTRVVSDSIVYEELPVVNTGFDMADEKINRYLIQNYDIAGRSERMQPVTVICGYVWLIGMILMLGYFAYGWYCLKKRVSMAVPKEIRGEKVYCCEAVDAPFLFGIIKPRIYLPIGLNADILPYVVAHEKAHRERRDYFIKPVACLLFIVYWFNPLLWISYILLCRDIEYACDERVIRKIGKEHKKAYSSALLLCSVEKRKPNLCPVSFGETGIKDRVLKVLSYKKPAVWVSVAAGIVCLLVVLCFMTQKKLPSPDGGVIEYDGYRIILENGAVCEETEGIRLNYRITSDKRSEKEIEEFGRHVHPGISGAYGGAINEAGDYEASFSGFYSEETGGLESALTFWTGEGMEIGNFAPLFFTKEQAQIFEVYSEADVAAKAKVIVSSYFMKIEFEDAIPDKEHRFMLLMDTKQGERWKVTRIPMQVTGKQDSVSYDQEVWVNTGAQNEEKGWIFLAFMESINLEDIQSFIMVSAE